MSKLHIIINTNTDIQIVVDKCNQFLIKNNVEDISNNLKNIETIISVLYESGMKMKNQNCNYQAKKIIDLDNTHILIEADFGKNTKSIIEKLFSIFR